MWWSYSLILSEAQLEQSHKTIMLLTYENNGTKSIREPKNILDLASYLSQLNTNLTFYKIDVTISTLFSTVITGLKPKLLSAAHHNCILLAFSQKPIYANPVLVK